MKYYAIFHAYIADRSVLRLDGRCGIERMHADAIAHAKRHKMTLGTYTIERGKSLSQTFAITLPRKLPELNHHD